MSSLTISRLYAGTYFAPIDSLASVTLSDLHRELAERETDLGEQHGGDALNSATLYLSRETESRFDPNLSMREPYELQLRDDGAVLEIEFLADDIRETGNESPGLAGTVLSEWSAANGVQLLRVFNDLGRSLPDVWNATFKLSPSWTVSSAVGLADRAAAVVAVCRVRESSTDALLQLLRAGDADSLLSLGPTAVLEICDVDDLRDERQQWQVAAAVCAMANSPAGGIVVCRARADHPAGSPPSEGHDPVARVADLLRLHLFPSPTELGIEQVPVSAAHGATLGHVVVSLPPQEVDIKPFLVYGVGADEANEFQALAIVERRGVTIQRQSVSATHAQLVAGRALLRGRPARQ